ncbi:MAG TPA: hypothetical protein VNK67_08005, partial [Burkholderiales bacterium]|nr:hypothetical protein [Burkholderiales bacterium]
FACLALNLRSHDLLTTRDRRPLALPSGTPEGAMRSGARAARGLLAGAEVGTVAARARDLARAGRGRELLSSPGWWWAIGAESLLDRLTGTPDALGLVSKASSPALFIRGDRQSPERYPGEGFRRRAGGKVTVEIVPDCGHFDAGREQRAQQLVSSWLARHLPSVRRPSCTAAGG